MSDMVHRCSKPGCIWAGLQPGIERDSEGVVYVCPLCRTALRGWFPKDDKTLPQSPLKTQQGGNHYKSMKIQPVEYIHANGIGYCEGAVIKYVSRWRNKNGIEDLRKAKHFIDLLIELESDHDQDTAG